MRRWLSHKTREKVRRSGGGMSFAPERGTIIKEKRFLGRRIRKEWDADTGFRLFKYKSRPRFLPWTGRVRVRWDYDGEGRFVRKTTGVYTRDGRLIRGEPVD